MLTVIRHGRVIDPQTGTDGVLDVLFEDDRLVALGDRIDVPAGAREIDATDMWVLPGFIDVHTHSDFTIGADPQALARIYQGITTDVTGNCGFSPFPLEGDKTDFGSFFSGTLTRAYRDLEAFAQHVGDLGPALNLAPLIGLGTVRERIMQGSVDSPHASQISQMRDEVEKAMQQGAFGASSGLVYSPGRYSTPPEVQQVLRPVGKWRALYATHIRDERDGLVAAVREAIETAEAVGASLQISHHKAVGEGNWGSTELTLEMIDEANRRGLIEVALDYYPYTAGSTGISSLLPPGALDGGWQTFRMRVEDESFRKQVIEHISNDAQFRPDEVTLGHSRTWPDASGADVLAVAARKGCQPAEVILRLIVDEGEFMTIVVPAASDKDLHKVMSHARSMHGSDGWLMTKEQSRHEHPRNLGSAIRVLTGAIAGEMSVEDAVARLATRPARRLGLTDRGTLGVGAFADLVVVDPRRAPRQQQLEKAAEYPDLMEWVFVNGQAVIERGTHTGKRPGRVLRAR